MRWGRVTLDAGFVLLISSLVYFDKGMLLWNTLLAAILHEIGHYTVLCLQGGRIDKLNLSAGGFCIEFGESLSYKQEIIAVSAGPLTSLLLAFVFSVCFENLPLAGMCFAQGVFNLLPITELDGGRMLLLLLQNSEIAKAQNIMRIISTCFFVLICVAGLWVLVKTGKNASLLLCALCLLPSIKK